MTNESANPQKPTTSDSQPTESQPTESLPTESQPTESSTPSVERIAALDRRLTAVEAELGAVRGLLDGVDAVDESIDRRASLALAKVERLERTLGDGERGLVRERLPDAEPSDPPSSGGQTFGTTDGDESGPGRTRSRTASDSATPDTTDSRRSARTGHASRAPTGPSQMMEPIDGKRGASTDEGSLASRLRDAFR